MTFNDTSSKWIWGYKTGSAISSDSVTVNLAQHSKYGTTTLNLQNAAGGSSSNPFLTSAATNSSTGTGSSGSTGSTVTSASSSSSSENENEGESEGSEGSIPVYFEKVVMAHAIMAATAFAVFFPFGAIAIRTFSFKGLLWFHAGWMIFTYMVVLAALGMGIWMAVLTEQLDAYHSIIGLAVIGALLIQPVTGMVHHLLYKKLGRANAATHPHVWWGRAVITLGIINGGLGLQLSENTKNGEIAYAVVAAFMWLLWMAAILMAFLRIRNKKGENGERGLKNSDTEGMSRNESGQISPAIRASSSAEMFQQVNGPRK
jgi:hypothetical protein